MKTIYTVPPHVGARVEVPDYCFVSFYDPATRTAAGDLGPKLQSIDGTLYGRHVNGDPITDREAAGKPAFVKTGATGDDKCNSAIPQTPQSEPKFVYFRFRGDNTIKEQIILAFRKLGASVAIVDTDGPSRAIRI